MAVKANLPASHLADQKGSLKRNSSADSHIPRVHWFASTVRQSVSDVAADDPSSYFRRHVLASPSFIPFMTNTAHLNITRASPSSGMLLCLHICPP